MCDFFLSMLRQTTRRTCLPHVPICPCSQTSRKRVCAIFQHVKSFIFHFLSVFVFLSPGPQMRRTYAGVPLPAVFPFLGDIFHLKHIKPIRASFKRLSYLCVSVGAALIVMNDLPFGSRAVYAKILFLCESKETSCACVFVCVSFFSLSYPSG